MALRDYSKVMLSAFGNLFYTSKVLGILPFSLSEFYYNKILRMSKLGVLQVIIYLIFYTGGYHILMRDFSLSAETRQSSTLTFVIGVFLNYLAPFMMVADLVVSIINQKKVVALFERFKSIDEKLFHENIIIDNNILRTRINIILFIVFVGEILVVTTKMIALDNINYFTWYLSGLPTLINAIEKVWFASLLYAIKQRFQGINEYMEKMVQAYAKQKNSVTFSKSFASIEDWNIGYLHKEIFLKQQQQQQQFNQKSPNSKGFKRISGGDKRINKVIPVIPWDDTIPIKTISDGKLNVEKTHLDAMKDTNDDDEIITAGVAPLGVMKMEVKLNVLTQLHDEICEIGKMTNSMWSIQMLFLMAYGFMSITAQFYFFYCGIVGQDVPILFSSAKNLYVSGVFIIFTAAKCVYIIYLSWQTKLESRRTGVCLHKSALAVDENSFYEVVNHLSLKILNHAVNFSACGFFNLDMTTIYGVTGAITSYLVILIQFNLAAHQARRSLNSTASLPGSNETSNPSVVLVTTAQPII